MEAPPPKVHRHRHHRRCSSRRSQQQQQQEESTTDGQTTTESQSQQTVISSRNLFHPPTIQLHHPQLHQSQPNDNPAVLVNGHEPDMEKSSKDETIGDDNSDVSHGSTAAAIEAVAALNDNASSNGTQGNNAETTTSATGRHYHIEPVGTRKPLQLTPHGSPKPQPIEGDENKQQHSVHRGILGFMDRELKATTLTVKKTQSLSDPQASPAQRSTRSRSSLDKSPRKKRSKSESKRRRERKLIAAGEMEVRQANETLMKYLKQVSELNDASLSGELEIDQSFDERRVHRKTKSQRDKRGHLISRTSINKLYATGGGLSSILKDLSEDIVPVGNEIYNPFTPVVSPTEDCMPSRIDKMFVQTSSGYRPVDHFYKHPIGSDLENNRHEINNSISLSCALQRIWILISNICHGLLGGLALAHLLFVATSQPLDWTNGLNSIRHYSSFAGIYTNTFYCLAIICMVSIFDRMDICKIDFGNATEVVSFRWLIIAMIYIATIILTLCAEMLDETLYLTNSNITMFHDEMQSNQVLNVWNSLSIARSIGAIIGWIMIGLSPTNEDLLYENLLLDMEKYQLTNN